MTHQDLTLMFGKNTGVSNQWDRLKVCSRSLKADEQRSYLTKRIHSLPTSSLGKMLMRNRMALSFFIYSTSHEIRHRGGYWKFRNDDEKKWKQKDLILLEKIFIFFTKKNIQTIFWKRNFFRFFCPLRMYDIYRHYIYIYIQIKWVSRRNTWAGLFTERWWVSIVLHK